MVTSTQNRMQARAAILRWHRKLRATRPRCGAKRKHDGEPCQQIAMGNGRCHYHGGRTGSGKDWHKTKWPNSKETDAEGKLARKLHDQAKAAKARAKRLATMTPEQRTTHEAWQQSHRPGPAAARVVKRREREQSAYIAAVFAKERLPDPASVELQLEIEALERRLTAVAAVNIFD
ncbi:hypothetical protein C8J36_104136 [Rhizobium sp. PP-F2F-G48]|uniref:HGGxSTG domain-containing protein n=1 Tax=Rhizobium sp. PP-F2F-G48 TaxID=2135651 RepID=UPI00104456EB|nr:HGGxSTG domain-containing protein [Rhizobium sp. PP-F2F-G48]TCM54944.1 hypothetical protein C8J36_104136 [Rhizobium sp. PP-F2F-G48]